MLSRSRFRLLIFAMSLVVGGCAVPWVTQFTLPSQHTVVRDQLVVHSDFELSANHRLLEELAARRTDLQEQLDLPATDEPIHVFLFEDAVEFREFMSVYHPNFPVRRAFFLETDTRLQVYAHWGDRVAEDLRHEVTHGFLHASVPGLPLWLDEGLAEYSEASRGRHGLSPSHMGLLYTRTQQGAWQPDLTRLEKLSPNRDMTQEQYAEAWAWVHFLLESGPECRAALREYLGDLRRTGTSEPISERLTRMMGPPGPVLMAHLTAVRLAMDERDAPKEGVDKGTASPASGGP